MKIWCPNSDSLIVQLRLQPYCKSKDNGVLHGDMYSHGIMITPLGWWQMQLHHHESMPKPARPKEAQLPVTGTTKGGGTGKQENQPNSLAKSTVQGGALGRQWGEESCAYGLLAVGVSQEEAGILIMQISLGLDECLEEQIPEAWLEGYLWLLSIILSPIHTHSLSVFCWGTSQETTPARRGTEGCSEKGPVYPS